MFTLTTSVRCDALAMGNAFLAGRPENSSGRASSLTTALEKVGEDLKLLAEKNDIFAAQLEILQDPLLEDTIKEFIDSGQNEVAAVGSASAAIVSEFEAIDDEYLKARGDDVRDVCKRITQCLTGSSNNDFNDVREGDIIVAEELLPSDTALIDLSLPSGFITSKGSITSHVCIIARQHSISAITGVKDCYSLIHNGDTLIIDGSKGIVIVNPDGQTIRQYQDILKRRSASPCIAELIRSSSRKVKLMGNAGNLEDIHKAISDGAEGIGLFRTEFIFLSSNPLPDEEEQYSIYLQAASACRNYPLTIRTMDIGADKPVAGLEIKGQENPFLGLRGIRVSLQYEDIFKTQLRAILRASVAGNIRVMFPMISSIEEIRRCKVLLDICFDELNKEGIPCSYPQSIGIMVETPASVLMADEFAEEVSFFSIGTNDLTQYILAADRGNSSVATLYNSSDPAVLKAIQITIDAARRHNIEICVCGEMASDPSCAKLLISMGIDSLSCSSF